jgi:type I restriction enzyme, S subunit
VSTAAAAAFDANGSDIRGFIENFDVLTEPAGAIKRLRELILDLAVRGSLVPQLIEEGTSDALIQRLASARSKLTGTARVRSDLAAVGAEDQPFAVPHSWRWVRLGDFGGFLGGGTPAKSNAAFWNGPIPWVSPKDMKRPYIDDAEDHISEAAVEGSAVKLIPKRSLLLVVRGMILAHSFPVALTTKNVTINQDMKALLLAIPETAEYLLRACWAARFRMLQRVEHSSHGTCRLDAEAVEELPVPVPPLSEQRRIVAKVDELMLLVDKLAAKQTKKRETQARLRAACLDALTSAEGPNELAVAWKRAAGSLEVLFSRPDSVAELRRTVLRLAIRGALVPQDAKDQPPARALEEVAKKRVRLAQARKTGAADDLPAVADEEAPFTIPPSWTWTRFGQASICRDGQRIPVSKDERAGRKGSYDYYGASGVIDSIDGFIFDEPLLLVGEDGANLVNRSTPIAFIAAGKYWVNNHAHVLDAANLDMLRYLAVFVNAIDLTPYVTGTAQPKMNQAKMNMIPIALPPLPEQRRIVAKVEQLMKLCNDLEAKLRRAEETASKLVDAVVASMTSGSGALA